MLGVGDNHPYAGYCGRTKRLIKSSKLYWSDAGLALHLAGEVVPRGAHLENLVATDLLAWTATRRDRPSILHWRTTKGAEVDVVVETSQHVLPIEVKASPRLNTKDAQHLESFLDSFRYLFRSTMVIVASHPAVRLARPSTPT